MAPLRGDVAAGGDELVDGARRPVREAVVHVRVPPGDRAGLVVLAEREHAAGEAVRWTQVPGPLTVEMLLPDPVGVAACAQPLRALGPQVVEAQLARGEHGAGRAP